VADRSADRYGLRFSMSPVNQNDNYYLSGISHSLRKDDVYKGFFIPKGQTPYIPIFWDPSINPSLLLIKVLQ
jgi:hypothetical protein